MNNVLKYLLAASAALLCVSCFEGRPVGEVDYGGYYYNYTKTKINYVYRSSFFGLPTGLTKVEVPADVKTFEALSRVDGRDKDHIFFREQIVQGVDYATYRLDPRGFARDKDHVYRAELDSANRFLIVEHADPATFRRVREECSVWWVDKDHYFRGLKVVDVDYETMQVVSADLAFDKNSIYQQTDSCLQAFARVGEVVVLHDNFIRDDRYIYYNLYGKSSCHYARKQIAFRDAASIHIYYTLDEWAVWFSVDGRLYGEGAQDLTPQGFDAASFEMFKERGSYDYARDKGQAYYKLTPIPGADPATFEIVEGRYAKDKAQVYYAGQPLDGANPAAFEFVAQLNPVWLSQSERESERFTTLPDGTESFVGLDYTRDDARVYYCGLCIEGADPVSFEILGKDYFARDAQAIYYKGMLVVAADAATFEYVGGDLWRDKYRVYLRDREFEGADPATFKYSRDRKGEESARDKNTTWRNRSGYNRPHWVVDLSSAEYLRRTNAGTLPPDPVDMEGWED